MKHWAEALPKAPITGLDAFLDTYSLYHHKMVHCEDLAHKSRKRMQDVQGIIEQNAANYYTPQQIAEAKQKFEDYKAARLAQEEGH